LVDDRGARGHAFDAPPPATPAPHDEPLPQPLAPDERTAIAMFVDEGNGPGTESEQHMNRPSEAMRGSNGINAPTSSAANDSAAGAGTSAGAGAAARANAARESLVGKIVCPFCGQQKSASSEPCPRCTMEDTPATRQATKARIGPWYVLQNRSPSAPGMKYATLLWLVNKGHVTPRSVVRGPTTYQLWRYAAHVRGLSREFGLCYSCGGAVQKSDQLCSHCERPQDPPVDPDVLLDVRDGAAGQLRAPVMREVEPPAPREVEPPRESRDARAATEARRTPPPPVAPSPALRERVDDDFEDEDDEVEAAVAVSTRADEAHRGERLGPHNEMMVRPRSLQDLARTGGRMVSATHLAAALQEPADEAPAPGSRRWSVLNVVLFLLVLFSGAGAAVLYLKPQYREPTAKWVGSTWDSVRTKLASMQWSSPPGESPAPQRTAGKPAPQSTPAPAPAPQLASDQHKQPDPPPIQVAKDDSPKVEPKVDAKVERKPDPRLEAKVEAPKEQPKSEPQRERAPATLPTTPPQLARDTTTTAPPTKPQQPPQQPPQVQSNSSEPSSSEPRNAETRAPEPPSLEQAMEESRKLFGQAIDAEARGDYAAALRHYEQIKKLRRDAWPGGLQVRIDLAREVIKSRSAKSE
jgi:hypothetical protein